MSQGEYFFGFVFLIYEKIILGSFWLKEETDEGRLGWSGEVVIACPLSILNLSFFVRERDATERVRWSLFQPAFYDCP